MRNYFTFGNFDSRDFGVFTIREGVYNAPRRAYKQVSIPGRNGDLMIDQGRMENIDVKYPCLIYRGFDSNLAGLRSALLSQHGYVRIVDSFHPDEYRLGVYMDELSVIPTTLGDGGTFDVVFYCKPQRFLTSGETPVEYPPGIENSPNLIPYPYYHTSRIAGGITWTDNGDGTITADGTATANAEFFIKHRLNSNFAVQVGEYIITGCPEDGGSSKYQILVSHTVDGVNAALARDYGSGASFGIDEENDYLGILCRISNGQTVSNLTFKPMLRLASDTDSKWYPYWDGSRAIYNPTMFPSKPLIRVTGYGTLSVGDYSLTIQQHSQSYIDIDSDIEDCYCGTVNMNQYVSLEDFPELEPGVNGITHDSTITAVQITPRWYRV